MQERTIQLSRQAMNTVFEIAVWGGDELDLRTAAEEAFREIDRLEQQLSFYRSDSDIRQLNVYAAHAPVPVDPRLFYLLEQAEALNEETGGAFDVTVAPLMRVWGMAGGSGRIPDDAEIEAAREITGMGLVELDPEGFTVRFLREGVMIDLGAIGKGYAIDQAAEILRESEVGGALLHSGTSSVLAIGTQPDGSPWSVAIQDPTDAAAHLAVVKLCNNTLSVSGVHGKYFTEGEVQYGHVLDPRIGRPVQGVLLAAVVCKSATDGDALSTALLTIGPSFVEAIAGREPSAGALVVTEFASGKLDVIRHGL